MPVASAKPVTVQPTVATFTSNTAPSLASATLTMV